MLSIDTLLPLEIEGARLSTALDKHSFVYHTTDCLNSLSNRACPQSGGGTYPEVVIECAEMVHRFLVEWALEAPCNVVARVCDVIRGGALQTLSKMSHIITMYWERLTDELGIDIAQSTRDIRRFVQECFAYASYPPVAAELLKIHYGEDLTREQRRSLSYAVRNDDPGFEAWWGKAIGQIVEQKGLWKMTERGQVSTALVTCYNASVSLSSSFSISFTKPSSGTKHGEILHTSNSSEDRVCGGCKSTMYCSPACQSADWRRHRTECDSERRWREGTSSLSRSFFDVKLINYQRQGVLGPGTHSDGVVGMCKS